MYNNTEEEMKDTKKKVKKLQRKCWNCKCWLQEKMGLCDNPESPFYECNRAQYDWCGKIKY